MSKPIKIDLFDLGVLIDEIENYEKWINEKAQELSKRLAEEGLSEATIRFAQSYYAGNNDVKVHVERVDDKTFRLVAEGQSVLFIEFGTGIFKMDDANARADLVDGGDIVGHGQYGAGKGAQPYGWVYKGNLGQNPPWDAREVGKSGVLTRGNHANSAMYYTKKSLERKLENIAKEVFK